MQPLLSNLEALLHIEQANNNISIQDMGRPNSQHIGVSVSGVADEYAFLVANQQLGNNKNAPALEITLGQITATVLSTNIFTLTGADCRATLNEQPINCWQPFKANQGDRLVLQRPIKGVYTYLTTVNGFATPLWLGSAIARPDLPACSNLLYKHSSLLRSQATQQHSDIMPSTVAKDYAAFYADSPLRLRFIVNRHWQQLSTSHQKDLLAQSFKIMPQSNKMGYRAQSDTLLTSMHSQLSTLTSSLSSPVTFGTIQLPSAEQIIILMKDRQTIGGYPTIGTVLKTDLFRLSQLRSGDSFSFTPVPLQQAQQQLHAFYQRFAQSTD